jgi:hypothetical protein
MYVLKQVLSTLAFGDPKEVRAACDVVVAYNHTDDDTLAYVRAETRTALDRLAVVLRDDAEQVRDAIEATRR